MTTSRFVLFAMPFIACASCFSQTADLRFGIAPNAPIRYVWTSESWQRTEGKDPSRGTTKEGTATIVVEVERLSTADSATPRARLTIKSIAMEFETPMGRVRVDSEKPSDDPIAKSIEPAIKSVVGVPLDLRLADDGTIASATGAEALLRATDAKARFADEYLSLTGVTRKFGPIFSCLSPTEPQRPGASWTHEVDLEMVPGTPKLPMKHSISLKSISGDAAVLEHRGEMVPKALPLKGPLGATVEKVDATVTGSRAWNCKLGSLEQFSEDQRGEISMTISKDATVTVRFKLKTALKRAA